MRLRPVRAGRGRRRSVEWVRRGVRHRHHDGNKRRRRCESLRGRGEPLRERQRLLLGSLRPANGILRGRCARQLRGGARALRDVSRLLLALVRRRAMLGAGMRVGRARVRVGRRLLQRSVRRRRLQGAHSGVPDVGQRMRDERRVLLAALRVRAMLDRVVLLHPEPRRVHRELRLLRRRVHDRPGPDDRHVRRSPRRRDVLQRRGRRDRVQRVRRLLQSPLRAVRRVGREGLPAGARLSHRRRPLRERRGLLRRSRHRPPRRRQRSMRDPGWLCGRYLQKPHRVQPGG
jgi:hypothetical protein